MKRYVVVKSIHPGPCLMMLIISVYYLRLIKELCIFCPGSCIVANSLCLCITRILSMYMVSEASSQ